MKLSPSNPRTYLEQSRENEFQQGRHIWTPEINYCKRLLFLASYK
jgi:hypothetical protein